jgi:hypothetical protein
MGAPQKIQEKINLQSILSKNSPWAHMKLEIDVLSVARKPVK